MCDGAPAPGGGEERRAEGVTGVAIHGVKAKIFKASGGGWGLGVGDATLIAASESRDRDD